MMALKVHYDDARDLAVKMIDFCRYDFSEIFVLQNTITKNWLSMLIMTK